MICPSCQTENIEGVDECSNCGKSLYGLDLSSGSRENRALDFIREPISNLAKRPFAIVGSSDPVGLAIRQMQDQASTFVLVSDGDATVGILTSSDILHRVVGPNEDLNAVTCAQVMTPDPTTLEDSDSIALALNIMAVGEFRHIPIQENRRTIGVIDVTDVFRHISPNLA